MAIHEVTYYQAKCDLCGEICDDYGEHSAWSDPKHVFENLPDWTAIRTITGQEFHICDTHQPAGITWCQACDGELNTDNWLPRDTGLTQRCQHCKYPNNITLNARPANCCGACPEIEGGYDCTCTGNSRCKRNRLLNDPAKFYGKSGNWLSRLIDRILVFISR